MPQRRTSETRTNITQVEDRIGRVEIGELRLERVAVVRRRRLAVPLVALSLREVAARRAKKARVVAEDDGRHERAAGARVHGVEVEPGGDLTATMDWRV